MDTTYNDILTGMNTKFEELAGYSADDASDIGIRLKLLAGEIYNNLVNIDWLKGQVFPQSATGIYLDYHAEQRGLARKVAVKASGTLTFSVTSALLYDVSIPKGTVCVTSENDTLQYETTSPAVLSAGSLSVNVPAQATQGGTDGNCASNTISVIVSSLTGISAVNNASAFSGGADEESDDALRERLLDSYKNISNGSNKAFYKQLALKNENVSSAGVVASARGAGTVNVYIWSNGTPSQALISALQAEFNALREINIDIQVLAPTQVECSAYMVITVKDGYDFTAVKENCEDVIEDYISSLGIGKNYYIAEAGRRVLAVDGVENYYATLYGTDETISESQKAVTGTIHLTQST